MTGPPAAVARLRVAVRRALSGLSADPDRPLVLVACSGGPDSMALAAATAFVAPRSGFRAGLITVDHGLQSGSADRAATVADWARTAGLDPVEVATVTVDVTDGGPEGAARTARYAALTEAAQRNDAAAIVLGHTRDDQAETVLLALARGSGPRGLAAMPKHRGRYLRPLLDVPRADTVRACRDLDLPVWNDPHNVDPAFTRSRLRGAMPVLVETFGERVVGNLARTARLVAADNEALDDYAADLLDRARLDIGQVGQVGHGDAENAGGQSQATTRDDAVDTAAEPQLQVHLLAAAHQAVRTRALRTWVLAHGAEADPLSYVHIAAMDALVIDWRGQGPVFLPGGITVSREQGRLHVRRG